MIRIISFRQNNYFKKLLKSVVIGINALQECGLIEINSFLVSTEELTCEMVFEMIKNIEFKQILEENIKTMIKSLIS